MASQVMDSCEKISNSITAAKELIEMGRIHYDQTESYNNKSDGTASQTCRDVL